MATIGEHPHASAAIRHSSTSVHVFLGSEDVTCVGSARRARGRRDIPTRQRHRLHRGRAGGRDRDPLGMRGRDWRGGARRLVPGELRAYV